MIRLFRLLFTERRTRWIAIWRAKKMQKFMNENHKDYETYGAAAEATIEYARAMGFINEPRQRRGK